MRRRTRRASSKSAGPKARPVGPDQQTFCELRDLLASKDLSEQGMQSTGLVRSFRDQKRCHAVEPEVIRKTRQHALGQHERCLIG